MQNSYFQYRSGYTMALTQLMLLPRPAVLIADEDDLLVRKIAGYVESAGYRVMTATDGLSALRCIEQASPYVVVLDLDLPIVSGFRLVHLMRHDTTITQPAVVIMTAYPFQAARDATRAGVDAFVAKPIDFSALLRAIHCCDSGARPHRPYLSGSVS